MYQGRLWRSNQHQISGRTLKCHLCKHQQWLPLLCSDATLGLSRPCIPWPRSLPSHGSSHSSADLWGEVSGAGAFAQFRLGTCQGSHGKAGRHWSSPQSTLSALPQEQGSIHALFTHRLPTALLLVPAALQATKGACLPCGGCQEWGAQCVACTAYSPGQISLFLSVPSQKHRSQPDHFFSLPIWFHINLFYSLCCIGVFLSVSRLFSVRTVPHVDVFLMYLWRRRWSPRLTPLPSWRSLLFLYPF